MGYAFLLRSQRHVSLIKVTFHKNEAFCLHLNFPLIAADFSLITKPEFTSVSHQGMLPTSVVQHLLNLCTQLEALAGTVTSLRPSSENLVKMGGRQHP